MPGPTLAMSIAMIPARPAVSAWREGFSVVDLRIGRVFFSRFGGKGRMN